MKTAMIAAVLMLAGCQPTQQQWQAALPKGLDDCTFHLVEVEGHAIKVVRCPNSSTTVGYKHGKSPAVNTTVLEDDPVALKAQARAKALDKLTPAEREVLGLQ